MSFLDREPGLDNRCILALSQNNELFAFLGTFKKKVPAYTFNEDSAAFIQLYFDVSSLTLDEISFIEKIGGIRSNNKYVVKKKIEDGSVLEIIREFLNLTLCSSNYTIISDGWLVFDFSFHNSSRKKVSDILKSHMSRNERIHLLYLGKSEGLMTILSKLNESIPLSIVIYDVFSNVNDGGKELFTKDVLYGEPVNTSITDGKIRVILYSADGLNRVSAREVQVHNETLNALRTASNKRLLIRYNLLIRAIQGGFRIMVFLPSNLLNEYVSTILSTNIDQNLDELVVVSATSFGPEVVDLFE